MPPPLARTASSMRPRQASTVSTALIVGWSLPEWPTMSALAKLTTVAWNSCVQIFSSRQVASRLFVKAAVPSKGAGDLPHPIRSKVKTDARIVIANGGAGVGAPARVFVRTNKGNDELIGHASVVRLF